MNKQSACVFSTVLLFNIFSAGTSAQQSSPLGTSYGFPGNSSPAFLWPLGNSPVGGPALYPNGPSYGLSNSSGGFGGVGSGTPSAIGAIEPTVTNQQRQEFESGNSAILQQQDIFNSQLAASKSFLSGITSIVSVAPAPRPRLVHYAVGSSTTALEESAEPGNAIDVDKVLHDHVTTIDTVLGPNMP